MFENYDENKENMGLIAEYLIKNYGEDKTVELMKKHNEHLFDYHGLAWSLGKRDIEFFCMYFLQDTFLPKPDNAARKLAPVHYEMWHEAESMFIRDEFDKLAMAESRGTAKTTVFDTGVTIWLHAYEISRYTIVIGKVEQDSTDFIVSVRQAFEDNIYIEKAFGKLIDSKNFTVNKLELVLVNDTKVQALSSTSSIRGKKFGVHRPFVIIADDSQGKSDIVTQEARDKKYNTWTQDTEYAGDKAVFRDGVKTKMATKFIVLGTILHKDCFMSRIIKNRQYTHVLRRAVDFDVDTYFNGEILEGPLAKASALWGKFKKIYKDDKIPDPEAYATEFYYQHEKEMQYETIWPDKFTCIGLAFDYYTNPISFKQEMMNDASKIGEKWFKDISAKAEEEIESHSFTKTMLCIDPATSISKKADYSAMLVGSVADNDFRYIRKGIIERLAFDDYCLKAIELLIKYTDITHIDIEKNTYLGTDVLKIKELIEKTPALIGRSFTFINEKSFKNKDDRISTIIGAINNGQIIFNEDDKDFIQQIKDFCGQDFSEHDDAADDVARFENDIKNIVVVCKAIFRDRNLLF